MSGFEKANIIKESLLIVDKLANIDIIDSNGKFTENDFDYIEINELIEKAKRLRKSTFWNLT